MYRTKSESTASEDAILLKRYVHQKDQQAFARLVERHGNMVWSVCRRTLSQNSDVEDAFQATFLALVKHAATIRVKTSVSCWLHGVARRVSQNVRMRTVRTEKREREYAQSASMQLASEPDKMELAKVDEEIARLPSHYRLPIIHCLLQSQSHSQAARELNWPVGSVAGRLARAKKLLRSRLLRRGVCPALIAAQLTTPSFAIPSPRFLATLGQMLLKPESRLLPLTAGVCEMSTWKWMLTSVLLLIGTGTIVYFTRPAFAQESQPLDPVVNNQSALLESEVQDAEKPLDEVRSLKEERLNIILQEMELRRKNYSAGRETVDTLVRCQYKLTEAKLDVATNDKEKQEILEESVKISEQYCQVLKIRTNAGMNTLTDLYDAQSAWLAMRIRLAEHKRWMARKTK